MVSNLPKPLRRVLVATLAFAAATGLAACGGSSDEPDSSSFDDVAAAVDGLSGEARERALLELARAEGGKLTFYTSYSSSLLSDVADAFEDATDLDVAVYRAQTGDLQLRLIQEADADFQGADVVETGGLEMNDLVGRGILEPYASPAAAGLIAGAAQEGWTSDAQNTFVLTWNTDLLAPDQVPKSWEELADPRWKGKLALDLGDVEWYATLYDYWLAHGKSKDEVDRLFEAISANALVVKGHSAAAELQAAGEFPLFVDLEHLAGKFASDAAPLAWKPVVQPVVTKTDGVGPIASSAHPAAAMLFVDWLLGDGQKVLAEYGVATRKDLSSVADVETAYVDLKALSDDEQSWSDRYDALLREGTPLDTGS